MAKNTVQITGDTSNMTVAARNISGANPVLFKWGSFKGSPEEVRLSVISVGIGAKILNLRFRWLDSMFNRTTILGTIIPRSKVMPGLVPGEPNVNV